MSQQMLSLAWEAEVATHGMKIVLAALADKYQDKTNLCFPSINTLSRMTSMNRQGVINNIKRLEEIDVIHHQTPSGSS